VQLAQTGITGVKFILLDFFDKAAPPEKLPFPVPPNTIPTEPSTMKNLEDSLVRAAGQMPDIATALLGTVSRLNTLLDDVSDQRLPEHASATLGKVDATLGDLRSQIQALNLAGLSGHADRDLAKLEQTLDGVDKVLARLDGDDGLMQSAARATNSFNEVARGAQTVGPEMELTLKEVRGAARSIRRFADALERDPDMLLKGRATAGP
jgi:paraquat-inducible protein B